MSLQDRVILVTGASGTLGSAIVHACVDTGARLALAARHIEPLKALIADIPNAAERCKPFAADLSLPAEVDALVAAVAADWGGVDILLSAVGGWAGGQRLADLTPADWDAMLDINLRSVFLTCRAVLPYMVERGWGRIVNVASRAAAEPAARQAAYNVAKAGVVALTESLAQDYRRKGVIANVILPSVIDSPAQREAMPDADHTRWVKPDDIARTMLFLCGEHGSAFNGASLPMYAGL